MQRPWPLVFKDARVLVCDPAGSSFEGDVAVSGEHIVAMGQGLHGFDEVDCRGKWLLPGFVQTHIHLVQTLFRGLADDLVLLDWLRTRIWPLERGHDVDSTATSARLGVNELLGGGTTAALDMATVAHTDAVFEVAAAAGLRLFCGKAQMDRANEAGLSEDTDTSMRSANDLADRWHGRGRSRYAYAPRFVPSCTDTLLRACAEEARKRGALIHTHASENRDEVELVRALTGRDNVEHLDSLGLSGPDVLLAHCIHLTDAEEALLARTGTRLLHCPSSNLKLASGIARIPELLQRGVHVSIGADGAPCNNRLDAFAEMRLAALIQKPRLGATAMSARAVLGLMTREGAAALGLNAGVVETGRLADLIVLDPRRQWSGGDPYSAVVYQLDARAVDRVYVGGVLAAEAGNAVGVDPTRLAGEADAALARVRARTGI
ncbi:5-methylthioadenosine/S-adenosylhomocysteine deaminase [Deltaproteobacteria bacterium]|nr:5-methylthioadenosine/S-adenosylhomocysteine deaminase [Deltaproteobacteria bacterium]